MRSLFSAWSADLVTLLGRSLPVDGFGTRSVDSLRYSRPFRGGQAKMLHLFVVCLGGEAHERVVSGNVDTNLLVTTVSAMATAKRQEQTLRR